MPYLIMTTFKFIASIFIAILFLSFRPFTNEVYITGHIRKNPKGTSASVSHLVVFVKGDNKILAKTITNDKGDFNLSFEPKKEKSFDFYCNGIAVDTMLIASVTTFESDTPEMTFYIPAKYKTSASGKVICPKCNRTDKICKIIYSDNPTYVRHTNISGDTTYSPLYNGTYQEDCSERPAKFYCERDKIKF